MHAWFDPWQRPGRGFRSQNASCRPRVEDARWRHVKDGRLPVRSGTNKQLGRDRSTFLLMPALPTKCQMKKRDCHVGPRMRQAKLYCAGPSKSRWRAMLAEARPIGAVDEYARLVGGGMQHHESVRGSTNDLAGHDALGLPAAAPLSRPWVRGWLFEGPRS